MYRKADFKIPDIESVLHLSDKNPTSVALVRTIVKELNRLSSVKVDPSNPLFLTTKLPGQKLEKIWAKCRGDSRYALLTALRRLRVLDYCHNRRVWLILNQEYANHFLHPVMVEQAIKDGLERQVMTKRCEELKYENENAQRENRRLISSLNLHAETSQRPLPPVDTLGRFQYGGL